MHHIHRASFILLLLALLAPCSALAADIDDPDWKDPGLGYMGANYLLNLEYALEGNAKAMVNLAAICRLYGDLVQKELNELPPQIFTADYWRAWAERYTSKGWRLVREGDARDKNVDNYREAAEAGNAEGMYKYAKATRFFDKACKYMTESAAMGNPDALFEMAYGSLKIRSGSNYCSLEEENIPQYIDLIQKAAAAGSPQALVYILIDYYNGEHVTTKTDFETAGMYMILANHFARDRDKYTRDYVKEYSSIFPTLPPEVQLRARERADAWLKKYNAPRQEALEAERERRKPLTVELRKELAAVVTWLEELQRQGR